MSTQRHIGILTGGGDAPGLNGILESSCRTLLSAGYSVTGICDGFEGIFEHRTRDLRQNDIAGIHSRSGTLLGTSNKSDIRGREKEFLTSYKALHLDGMIVAGGDGTFAGLKSFAKEIPIVGVPKTIDNDLSGTDLTFGYDTACAVVADAADALRESAEAHRRVIVVETMGRTAGWIALGGGLASYADVILIPERPFLREALLEFLRERQKRRSRGCVVVAAEGATAMGELPMVAFRVPGSPQAERYGGIGSALARWIEHELHWESRDTVLGHLQRAHPPTTTDRFLTLAMGVEAARMVIEGDSWGQAVVYRDGHVKRAPLGDLMGPARKVPEHHHWIEMAKNLSIFI